MYENYTTTYRDYYIKVKQKQLQKKLSKIPRLPKLNVKEEFRRSRLLDSLDLCIPTNMDDSTQLFIAAEKYTKFNPNLDSTHAAGLLQATRVKQIQVRRTRKPSFQPIDTDLEKFKKKHALEHNAFTPPADIPYKFSVLKPPEPKATEQKKKVPNNTKLEPLKLLREITPMQSETSSRASHRSEPVRKKVKFESRKPARLVTGFSQEIRALEKSIATIDRKLNEMKLKGS